MREILFRGKRLDDGEWAEGDLIQAPDGRAAISTEEDLLDVDPKTVCQYTGLTDENGRRIFEGDIMTNPHSNKKGFPAEVCYQKRNACFHIERIGYVPISLEGVNHWGEVIGNIFDNPELIEWRRRRITPRKPTDRGGYLAMPLASNVPKPSDKTWKKTICPICGEECWDRPLPEGFTEDMFDGKRCTMCALKAAGL